MDIEKYIHIYSPKIGNKHEVLFMGQPCITVTEGNNGSSFYAQINPLFARMIGVSDLVESFYVETMSTLHEAVAAGITKLQEAGAFAGIVDISEE